MMIEPTITVSVVNDYPVVVHGISDMLSSDPRFEVVEVATSTVPERPVDVILFDAFAKLRPEIALSDLLRDPRYIRVLIYSDNLDPQRAHSFMDMGVAGYVSKALGTRELCDAIVRAHNGEPVMRMVETSKDAVAGDWPGRDAGLSAREAEMIALIAQGITNQNIAASCYLSINSVKSYIRSAYRKIGVTRRSQAVLWGVAHGMLPGVATQEFPDSQQPEMLG